MAEIKISELSIGDWVRDGNGIIAKVRGIDSWNDGYILNVQTVSGSICNLSATVALSIPLTPEILEKNGFVYSRVTRWYNCEIGHTLRTRIGVHFNAEGANRIEISSVDAFDEDWSTIDVMINKPIKGVHQLQHALRLAEVGKEIEL